MYKKGSSIAAAGSYIYNRNRPTQVTKTWTLLNTFEMVTDDHSGWSSGRGDMGGPFLLRKVTQHVSPSRIDNGLALGDVYISSSGWAPLTMPSEPTNAQLDAMGTTAIARVEPTSPSFDLYRAIGEIRRDGIPHMPGHALWKERTHLAKGAGGDYLNVQFGWSPLVSDIRNFAKSVKNADRIISQYRKGSDQKIRRRYDFDSTFSTKSLNSSAVFATPAEVSSLFGKGVVHQTIRVRKWFSGAFRYHVPISDTQSDTLATHLSMANKVLGVKPTPESMWELQPWTWAIDWFSNTGDILHNISALGRDGLVMQYGYCMQEHVDTQTYSGTHPQVKGSMSRTVETKYAVRRPATPFGFGFDLSGITPSQTSILVALGLSHT